jgi:predicted ATPase/class 3 adenylate cyclase
VITGDISGIVTILFTDVEGSTRLWEREPEQMRAALARHDAISRAAVQAHRGIVVKTTGDGVHAVFDDPLDAVEATLALQRALLNPGDTGGILLRVRCGLNLGVVERRDNDVFGTPVNRTARIMAAAHGGQVLVSKAVADLICSRLPNGVALKDLGAVRLRDLARPERVYQVVHPQLQRDFPALRSLDATPNNLPQQVTSFIGREQQQADVKALLRSNRLVTLVGVGGIGKTRLALQAAADVLEDHPDGVWLVELAPLTDPRLVPQALASVVGVKEEAGRPVQEALVKFVADRQLLLVFDNCEHLVQACAELALRLLQSGSRVKILATSREHLNVGETIYAVPTLTVPPERNFMPAELAQYESARLFVERAQLQRPQFTATDENAPALGSICHRLDGIPLALELAAARLRSLSVEEVNQRLDQRFRLLKGGSRTAPPRQQTLRSLIDWSYDLLNDAEKSLLRRVSIFAGGWTLAAAEAICDGEGVAEEDVLDILTSLVDKSLVGTEERNGATRYRLLETVRQYARDRLREGGEEGQWQSRHLAHFIAVAEEAEPQLMGADQQSWLDRLEMEHDNLRSALTWSSTARGDAAGGLRLAGAFWRFWWMRGHLREGRGWLSGLLAAAPGGQAAASRAKALNGAGVLAWQQGDYPAARTLHEESLAIQRELGDRRGIAYSLNNLGTVATSQGDHAAAWALCEESLAIIRGLGNRWHIAGSLINLGSIDYLQGNLTSARQRYEESLAIYRELGDRWGIAAALINLGSAANDQCDYRAASAMYKESLAIHLELGDRWGIAESLQGLAYVAFALFGPARAARIWGGAERLREEIGSPVPPRDRPRYDGQLTAARAAMADHDAFDLAWQEGRAMTLEQAIEYALNG